MLKTEFHRFFTQIVGSKEDQFFDSYWRQRVLLSKSAISPIPYTCQEFLSDYRRENRYAESLIVAIDESGVRRMEKPTPEWSASASFNDGVSLVLQAIMLPRDSADMPAVWKTFVDLQYDLCAYLLPEMPPGLQPDGPVAAVDIFYTAGETSTGGHYDPGDVFYFVLDGEKEWTVELTPDPETVLKLYASPHEMFMSDHQPTREHITINVQPGDCLYVPPFTYHRVSSHGPTLGVSIGLPTYTEATLLRTLLRRLQRDGRIWNIWKPLPSFPASRTEQFELAQEETRMRVSEVIHALGRSIPAVTHASSSVTSTS